MQLFEVKVNGFKKKIEENYMQLFGWGKNRIIKLYNYIYPYLKHFGFDMRYHYRVMSFEETIEYIKENHCSISRFGDGEFGIIIGTNHPDFQKPDVLLSERLLEVCRSKDKRILICIPHSFKNTEDCNEFAKKFWQWWIWENNNLENIAKCLQLNWRRTKVYGDAQITRPYMDWKDKTKAPYHFSLLKSLWTNQNVLIVEGEGTKLGIGNDLFTDAISIQRIEAPSKDAFSFYEQIFAETMRYGKEKLILVALGPTATVLAYDLAKAGFRALDIGHVDIEYEWFLAGANEKQAVKGKQVQEMHDSNNDFDVLANNSLYLSEIVSRIGC